MRGVKVENQREERYAVVMRIIVNAKPNARETQVTLRPDGSYTVAVTEPPREGKANAAIAAALAEYFGKRRADVALVSGFSSRRKTFEIL